ncbi:MAG: 7-carboxy-7-deazaguanine synthase QueE [Candidatus Zixiibacteriota bacterium]|nr:MAG: 7-carboxy-7-deazaguanine synthase QueE [candidate division Zixibacteria bacterium]
MTPSPHVAPLPELPEGKLPVNEIFYSLQGEGRWLGTPAVFLRLNYCNLGCSWCDTPYCWDPTKIEPDNLMTPDEISAAMCEDLRGKDVRREDVHVVITGGEPLLHQPELPGVMLSLKENGFAFFEVETNGTIVPSDEMIAFVSWWNCSPKLSNNGLPPETNLVHAALWKIAASGKADFKFVVTGPEDIKEINRGFLNLIPREAVILMPEGDTAQKQLESMPRAMKECARHGFRFSPRLHVLAWNNERKR